ncbi:MAG: GTP cyclohydrolase II [Gemmatimonadetes bacterium]|nr:GTP cyclohydrolase II [Gemmatimonadota bacterium]
MAHKAERGVFELRQGRVLCITDGPDRPRALVAAVEGLGVGSFDQLRSFDEPLRLVVTAHRGRAMGLRPHEGGANISLELAAEERPETILALAADRRTPRPSSGMGRGASPASRAQTAGLTLVRLGGLLPAIVAVELAPGSAQLERWLREGVVLDVSADEVERAEGGTAADVRPVAEAPVPLAVAENSRIVFFREGGGLLEHVAVLIGPREAWPDPVPARLHSACLTGDLFGSMRCDCGEQLRGSLDYIKRQGGGVLVYLAQEGRGIGLGNKIRAYTLQEAGLDTIDADGVLGFGEDGRRYEAAVGILHHLGVRRVELLTNNPQKVRALEESGIQVAARTPIFGGINRHNLRYVQAKVDRSGHWLTDMISQRASGIEP